MAVYDISLVSIAAMLLPFLLFFFLREAKIVCRVVTGDDERGMVMTAVVVVVAVEAVAVVARVVVVLFVAVEADVTGLQ